ncbi:MAG: FAD-binding oxidoreductase [Acidobacteria bacterium]|nr:FAD-binding oxidoreductase [Acidobacteriota bacterium]
MRNHARVVIIGGGATGCSLLYHLVKLGWTDAVLLEREKLTAGSTWHAAGNCARFSHNVTVLRIRDYSICLYQEIEADTGQAAGYHITGGLSPARNQDRIDEYRYFESLARSRGFDVEMIGVEEVKKLHPLLNTKDYIGAYMILWKEMSTPAN